MGLLGGILGSTDNNELAVVGPTGSDTLNDSSACHFRLHSQTAQYMTALTGNI